MDAKKINMFLHSSQVSPTYHAKTGETLSINLPRIPLTRYTEYLELRREFVGDTGCFRELPNQRHGEGNISPEKITLKALHPGQAQIVIHAVDALSGEKIPEVEPLSINVDIEED